MAYVPQFIPTNTQVLQGTLDQYQKASDMETARLNQANDLYSAIPTTNPYDTSEKNKIMGDFQKKVIEGLDKKYNYDRANTQYAKDLANEIRNLRSNPLWSLVKQRDELDKLRQNVIATKGADFYENFNPDAVTDINKLKDWKPMDINDVKVNAALKAKEYATSWKGRVADRKSIPGTIQYLDKWGASNETEAANYIDQHPEEVLSSIPQGFDPNDPRVFTAARNAWISNAIGEVKPSSDPDYEARAAMSGSGSDPKQPSTPLTVSNDPIKVSDYYGESVHNITDVEKDISAIDKKLSLATGKERQTLQDQKNSLQLAKDKMQAIVDDVESQNPEVVATSKNIISSPFLNIQGKASTEGGVRMGLTAEQVDTIEGMVKKLYSGTSGLEKLGNTAPKQHAVTKEIYRSLYGKELPSPDKMTGDDKNILRLSENLINEWGKFYRGVDNYGSLGYKKNVVEPANKLLKDGVQLQYSVEDPGDIGSTRYNEVKKFTINNMKYMLPIEEDYRQGSEWDKKKLPQMEIIMSDPATTINYLYNTEGDALIRLHNPKGPDGQPVKGGTNVTLRVDPKRSNDKNDIMGFYYNDTQNPSFLSQTFNAFDLAPNKLYNFSSKDNYLKSALLNTKAFTNEDIQILQQSDIQIKKSTEGNQIYYTIPGVVDEETNDLKRFNKMALMQLLKTFAINNKQ